MKLRFLGQAYCASDSQIDTLSSEYTARFLGQNYIPRRPVSVAQPQLGIRKYRGVAYGA